MALTREHFVRLLEFCEYLYVENLALKKIVASQVPGFDWNMLQKEKLAPEAIAAAEAQFGDALHSIGKTVEFEDAVQSLLARHLSGPKKPN